MGVWAKGPNPTTVDVEGIAEVMRPAVEAWMSAHIHIYDPARYGASPSPILVFDSGEDGAIIQPLRAPRETTIGSQPNAVRAIRFQVKQGVVEVGQRLRGGLVVKVIDGGNAKGLEDYVFALLDTVDSSLMWDHIYEANVITGGV